MGYSKATNGRGRVAGLVASLRDRAVRREAGLIAPYVDAAFYLRTYADVAASGHEANFHYARYGWREGRDPSPSFSTRGYLSAHPEVAMAGINPLLHFVERRAGAPDEPVPAVEEDPAVEVIAPEFDRAFYEATYPGYRASALDPVAHYCAIGWREGHDPAPDFSTSYYLTTNPDIRESGVNPFWHYLIAGREEGRLATHPGGWRHDVIARRKDFDSVCEDWVRSDAPPPLMPGEAVAAALGAARRHGELVVSVGHDDYRATPGGVQLCIGLEERRAAKAGADYLNLHPWQPLPKLAGAGDDPILKLVLNGADLGAARSSDVAKGLKRAGAARLVVHHLAGHAPERVAALARGLGVTSCLLWLHDYFTLCTSFALQRNDVAPCSAPEPASNACGICLYGRERRRQLERLAAFFDTLEVHVVAPSQAALGFWRDRATVAPASTRVIPHVTLKRRRRSPVGTEQTGPVRIAFVGTRAPHKGWPVFLELRRRLATAGGYDFWHFGAEDPRLDGLGHVPAHVRADDPRAMMEAIAAERIDLVLHWASWRETFSFSTFEALAGGAFVLTNEGSGNVAAAVRRHRAGAVLADADALYALAKSGGLATLAAEARARRQSGRPVAQFSAMSFEAFGAEVPA